MRDHMRGLKPDQENAAAKLMFKHWPLISSVLMCAVSLGIARGKYSDVAEQVKAIDRSHPDATAAITRRNTDEIAEIRSHIDQIHEDVAATRVDVAKLCMQFGLQPAAVAQARK